MAVPLALAISCGQSQQTRQQSGTQQHQSVAPQTSPQAQAAAQVPAAASTSTQTATSGPAKVIPDFTFYILRSGIRFEKSDLNKDDKHVFILFDPGCTYCQYEARDIGKNFDKFENTSFYFVSMNDPGLMATFFATYAKELDNQPNVHMLYDRNVHFINRFHVPSQFPATYVYDQKQMLKTYWNGMKSAEEVVREITK